MASNRGLSRSTSPSDGEILESDSEKANTSAIRTSDTIVDLHSRELFATNSTANPNYAPAEHPDQLLEKRSRSRSPYRQPRKRSHVDDHYRHPDQGSRRFKAYYEDGAETFPPARKESVYIPRSRNSTQRSNYEHGDPSRFRHGMPWHGRGNTHSEADHESNLESGGLDSGKPDQRKSNQQGSKPSKGRRKDHDRHLVSAQNHDLSSSKPHSRHLAESDRTQTFYKHPDGTGSAVAPSTIIRYEICAPCNDPTADFASDTSHEQEHRHARDAPLKMIVTDEALLIEERRKRRIAILAKHKHDSQMVGEQNSSSGLPTGQERAASPLNDVNLLAPDVQDNSEGVSIPTQDVDSGGTAHSNDTIKSQFIPNSEVSDLIDREEPSAVDYDPRMDMQEIKLRQNNSHLDRMVNSSKSSGVQEDLPQAPSITPQMNDKDGEEFDMFAEGEGLDMFAEGLVHAQQTQQDALRPHDAMGPQAIDMSMLDDWDDHDGYYKVKLGELLDGRYHVQSNLGKGMFSGVVRATDQDQKQTLAIKIVRNNDTMHKAGLKEIAILQKLCQADPEDRKHLIRLERHFEHKGHLCMVFENLSINLREVLKKFGRDVGINLKAVRIYAQQMFLGLSLLRKCNILHADLKPDNVLVNETRNVLKICDLGSASDVTENDITQYLVSRFYRAPEIILGCPYDYAIDMWSIGCTLFELYTGRILFTGRNNNQMLRGMMDCRGKFSQKMLRRGQFTGIHFDDLLNFRSLEKDRLSGKDVVRLMNITKPTKDLRSRLLPSAKGLSDAEMKEFYHFVDLLDRCLNLNPEKRCTPQEALKHPFITRQKT